MNKTAIFKAILITYAALGVKFAWADAIKCQEILNPASRLAFIRARNAELNSDLKNSRNRPVVEAAARASLAGEAILKRYFLASPGHKLNILRSGFGKPTEVVLVNGENRELLFSSFQLKRNGSYVFVDSALSADRKTLVMAFAENGSDNFHLVVLDLHSKQVIEQIPGAALSDSIWVSPDEFLFKTISADFKYGVSRFSRTQRSVTPELNFLLKKGPGEWSAQLINGAWSLISNTGEQIPLGIKQLNSILAVTNQDVVLQVNGTNNMGRVIKISRGADGPEAPVILRDEDRLLTSASVESNYLIAQMRWGAQRWIQVRDLNGRFMDEITVPNCCSVASINWEVPGKKLRVSLVSAVSKSKPFIYDLDTKSWDRSDFAAQLLSVDGINYLTTVDQIPSEDGTLIPVRLTHRADLIKDGSHPTLFEQYGGFGRPGMLDPSYDPMLALFIKHGGVYATPALRGGNEFGPDWHKQGMLENKKATMQDLIASARWMTKENWTSPNRIILKGNSNGGLTVASAALQAPEAFGLVIPIAGVHDLLQKEELNPWWFDPGWLNEYGDSREPAPHSWLEAISPVELAKLNSKPNFIIITGRNDSRVNPEHSYRLAEALLANEHGGSEIRMLGLNNSGHWIMHDSDQNQQIALRATVVMWTKIFDYLGWNFN